MATTIKLKSGSGAPLAGDLVAAEPALDLTNKRLYTENSGGTVIEIGTSPSTIDINAGTIDGTVIGGSSAAAGTFTTFTSTGIDDNATSTAITIDASENVNIGAVGTTTLTTLTGPFNGDVVKMDGSSGVSDRHLIFSNSSNSQQWDIDAEGGASSLGVLSFSTNSTERLRIDSSGNVGIGETSPATMLEVNGNWVSSQGQLTINAPSGQQYTGLALQNNGTAIGYLYADNTGNNTILYSTASKGIQFYTNNSVSATITSAGAMGIGTTSPSTKLHLSHSNAGATSGTIRIQDTDSQQDANQQTGGIEFYTQDASIPTSGVSSAIKSFVSSSQGGAYLTFGTAADNTSTQTERMRIDSSGNLLVGKASADNGSTAGHELHSNDTAYHTRSGGAAVVANRLLSDGVIVNFAKDGTTVGSIGNDSTNLYVVFSDTNNIGLAGGSPATIFPTGNTGAVRDNAVDLGYSSGRFDDIYATNGTIQTSDANEKQDIEALSEAETRVAVAAKALLRKFRWKSAVEEKGDEARIHFGIVAQDLKAAFEAEGLDAGRYAMFIHSTWTDEETGEERSRMGVRYSELLAFIIAAI